MFILHANMQYIHTVNTRSKPTAKINLQKQCSKKKMLRKLLPVYK